MKIRLLYKSPNGNYDEKENFCFNKFCILPFLKL